MGHPDFQSMTFDEVLAFCIKMEEEAVALYENLAAEATNDASRERFKGLAEMEQGHVRRLQGFDEEKFFETAPSQVIDLKTTDYMVDIEAGKRLTTQEALILAAKREKATRDLYLELAKQYEEEPFLHGFFAMMAEEEARHKHDLEQEYEKGHYGQGEF